MLFRALLALLFLYSANSMAQAPAAPPPIPADVSPLYVVTYVETRPTSRDETAALLSRSRRTGDRRTGPVS